MIGISTVLVILYTCARI